MIVKRLFHFPIATLFAEADLILSTAESTEEKDLINARLDDGQVAIVRALLTNLNPTLTEDSIARGDLGTMTTEQRAAIRKVTQLKTRARKSAKLAFRGQTTKLHDTFLVGVDTPANIGTVLNRADTIQAGCAATANAAPLKSLGGWVAKDNLAFATAIAAARTAFKDHLDALADSLDDTSGTTAQANALYLGLLTIQNAANNEHPEEDPANRGIRDKYRFGHFPPPHDTPPPATPAPASATPAAA